MANDSDTNGGEEPKLGLALSGGGSRAIAFHLGCMRVLQRRRMLDEISVVSSVSGGSVIGALWAYSDDEFRKFDKRIQALLSTGLESGIREKTKSLAKESGNRIKLYRIEVCKWLCGSNSQPPLPSSVSPTLGFDKHLDDELFHGAKLDDVKREGLTLVINATDLQSESGFYFGSKVSGSARYGELATEVPVSTAVAASAAYPVALPAIVREMEFKDGRRHDLMLTDGCVDDNTGITSINPNPSLPRRFLEHGVDFIIASLADPGEPTGVKAPDDWSSLMDTVVGSMITRTNSMAKSVLQDLQESEKIKGFLLPRLGQEDGDLDNPPDDLVPREAVCDYPTDFKAMSRENIDKISKRGEQLMNSHIESNDLIRALYPAVD